MKLNNLSLSSKLMTGFILMGMIPLLLLGTFLFRATKQINAAVESEYHSHATTILDKIERNLFERYGDAQTFAANEAVKDPSSWFLVGSASNKIARAANRYVALYGIYDLCMAVDLSGRVIAVNDRNAAGEPIDTDGFYDRNFSNAAWFTNTLNGTSQKSSRLNGTFVEDVALDGDVKSILGNSGYVLTFSAPVRDDAGNVIGVWHNKASFSVVEEIIRSTHADLAARGLGSAELTLLDRQGFILVDYDPAVRNGDTAVVHDEKIIKTFNLAEKGVAAAVQLVNGESGGGRAFHARKQLWQTCGYSKSSGALGYAGLGWGMMLRVSEAESLQLSRSILATTLWIAGFALIGLLVVSWWLGRSLSLPVINRIGLLEEAGVHVAHASHQISDASQSFADGASEQAASLEETSASLEEMSSMTKRNAQSAADAKDLAAATRDAARTGSQDMDDMRGAMADIKQSSDSIAHILKSIDEIAFQTNILALNAAVEAARAGEAGAGFAVVAEEVRNLAQRSAAAARETSAGIETAISRSERGVTVCETVATRFSEIARQAEHVDDLVGQIASACKEQSQGIEQINIAITEMDRQTQYNAGNAEETASASVELREQSTAVKNWLQELRELVTGTSVETKPRRSVARRREDGTPLTTITPEPEPNRNRREQAPRTLTHAG